MQTRSQTRSQNGCDSNILYEVNIDFDEASEAWKANKISIGSGSYKYLCSKRGKNGNLCIKKCLPGEEYCCVHYKMMQNEMKTTI